MESRNLTLDLTELWALGKEEKGDWRVKRMSIAFRGGNVRAKEAPHTHT